MLDKIALITFENGDDFLDFEDKVHNIIKVNNMRRNIHRNRVRFAYRQDLIKTLSCLGITVSEDFIYRTYATLVFNFDTLTIEIE